MKVERISRNDLRQMAVGQTIEFELPSAAKIESGRVSCSLMKLRGYDFTAIMNLKKLSLIITRNK